MNLFSSFLSVMTHVLRVLFLMLGWHVIWLPNGMEVNNKWSCCKKKKKVMWKMDVVERSVSRVGCTNCPLGNTS